MKKLKNVNTASSFGVHKSTRVIMEKLSLDLLGLVFQHLDALTLCNLAKVSKDFSDIANSDYIWIEAHGSKKIDAIAAIATLTEELDISRDICEHVGTAALAAISDCNSDPFRDSDSEYSARVRAHAARMKWSRAGDVVDKKTLNLSIGYRVLGIPFKLRRVLRENYHLTKNGKPRLRFTAEVEANMWEYRENQKNSLAKNYRVELCCVIAVSLGFP